MSLWEQGEQLMQIAETKERGGDIKTAFTKYQEGLECFVKALQQIKNPQLKKEKQLITKTYMNHAEELKKQINGNGNNRNNKNIRNQPRKQPSSKRKNNNNNNNNNNKPRNIPKRNYTKHEKELRQRIENEILQSKLSVKFIDVIGLENVKQALTEAVILPSQRPDIFVGPRAPPRGILLFGPPGNGKTFIAKALASECNATFFVVSSSTLTSRYVGEGEKLVRMLFEVARDYSPSIIFIDEIDSLLTMRGSKDEQESSRRMKTEFLIQMDGVQSERDGINRVLLVGATNLPWQLDDAVLRRFPKRILVDLPGPKQRDFIIRQILKKGNVDYKLSKNDFSSIVKMSNGYSCSDLTNLVNDSTMGPVRDIGMDIVKIKNVPPVKFIHFKEAFQNVKPSYSKQAVTKSHEWDKQFGTKLNIKKKRNNNNNNNNKNNIENKNNNNIQSKPNNNNKNKQSSSWMSLFN